jgi:hypothetical protein
MEADALVRDYLEGLTVIQVARKNRVRTSSVTVALNAAGVQRYRVTEHADRRRGVKHPSRWRPSQVRELPDTTWAYIAGIFDGEGNLRTPRTDTVSWRIAISQLTEAGLCQWLKETIGAGTCTPIPNISPPRRPMSAWRLAAQAEVADFLVAVEPYVIVKRAITDRALSALITKERTWEREASSAS